MKWKNLPKDQPICLTSSWFYASFDEHEDCIGTGVAPTPFTV
jgi:hypothetical protein